MQAIVETLFDAAYLISVITIGILMIRASRGNAQFKLFGMMAVVLGAGDSFHLVPRALALCTTGLENYTVSLGLGKWITSVTMTVFYVLLYYVWRKRYEIKGKAGLTAAVYGLAAARVILCMMPQNQWLSAASPLSWGIYRNIPFAILGLLPQREGAQRQRLPLDVADHRAELWLLYPRGAVGGYDPYDRYADDPQDLRLCVDGADRLPRHEAGVQVRENEKIRRRLYVGSFLRQCDFVTEIRRSSRYDKATTKKGAFPMAELNITALNFETEVLHSDKPVLLDFYANWCGPCKMLSPVLHEIAEEYADTLKVGKVNVDEQMELAMRFQVSSIPMVVLFKNGKAVAKSVGYRPKAQLLAMVQGA